MFDEFFAMRACIDVAVDAGEVAELAEVDLEDAGGAAGEGEFRVGEGLIKGVH